MSENAMHTDLDGTTPAPHGGTMGRVFEAVVIFLIGVLWMSFFYSGKGGIAGDEIGVPGNDSGYHVKMAAMLPEWGFVREFPWLRFAYFRNAGDEFVSHHVGFQVLLLPFVRLSHWLTGDYLAGGRWAICVCFGLMLVVYNWLLAAGNVRWRWLWLALVLLLPHQFFMRHANVRAICPALLLMLVIVLAMFRERWIVAGLAVMAFNLLYLGAVMFSPVIVLAFVGASMFGPAGQRRFPWRIAIGTLFGWGLGVLAYPYRSGMFEFLWLQVFRTGLNPDIRVGSEWFPYEGVWWFAAEHCGPTFLIWVAALLVRLRSGPALDARALSLVIMNFAFLALTLKSKRFIEYWPMFALLSAAYMAAPPLTKLAAWFDGVRERVAAGGTRLGWRLLVGAGLVVALVLHALIWLSPGLVKLVEGWSEGPVRDAALRTLRTYAGRMTPLIDDWQLLVMAGLFVGGAAGGVWLATQPLRKAARFGGALAALAFSSIVWAGSLWLAAGDLQRIQSSSRCPYELKAIREMMAFIQERSQPGDVIFTDDWDIFPIFFYHNSYNHYIVGLDPKFTHERRPDIWARYERITQARVPADTTVNMPVEGGQRRELKIHVELDDIRDVFGARWVICDRDHRGMAGLLNGAKNLAELVYPSTNYSRATAAPYCVFRIRAADELPASRLSHEAASPATPAADADGILYLGRLDPLSLDQGWGDLMVDASVAGAPIMLGATRFLNGLGTHAPSRIEYELPVGFESFEATVGIDSSQAPDGSAVVRVELDGREAFRSDLLTSEKPGVEVRVKLGKTRHLTLIAEPTDDGTRCDHVNWAGARLVRPLTD